MITRIDYTVVKAKFYSGRTTVVFAQKSIKVHFEGLNICIKGSTRRYRPNPMASVVPNIRVPRWLKPLFQQKQVKDMQQFRQRCCSYLKAPHLHRNIPIDSVDLDTNAVTACIEYGHATNEKVTAAQIVGKPSEESGF